MKFSRNVIATFCALSCILPSLASAAVLSNPAYDPYMGGAYGAAKDQGETDDPLVDGVSYPGNTYYVDCDAGSDTNSGLSPALAFKTLQAVWEKTNVGYWDSVGPNPNTVPQYHQAWTAATSGSAFLLKRGCRFTGSVYFHAYTTTTPDHYFHNFTLGAYGDRTKPRPIIQIAAGNGIATWAPPLMVRNIHLLNLSTTTGEGIWLYQNSNVTIANSEIEGFLGGGIDADNANNITVQNSVIYNNLLSGGRGGGFAGGGDNLKILHSTFLNNGRDTVGAHNLYVRHLSNTLFEGNLIIGGSNLGLVLHGSSNNVIIRGNDFYGNSNGLMISGYGNANDVFTNITIEKNLIHANGFRANEQGYGMLFQSIKDSVIRNNIVWGNRLAPFIFTDNYAGDQISSNVQFYNNLFADGSTQVNGYQSTGLVFKNNIFANKLGSAYTFQKASAFPDAQLTLDYNLYYIPNGTNVINYNSVNYTLPAFTTATGQEMHGKPANPSFTDATNSNFTLTQGSPAIDAGTSVGVSDDFVGTSRPQGAACDMGPYEFASGITTTPTPTPPPSPTPAVTPTVTLSATPASISAGQSSTLTWSSTNATSCSGSNFAAAAVTGSVSVTPTQTTTYSITCTGSGGSASASATVTVSTTTVTPPPPPTPSTFGIGTRVKTTANLNVRNKPNTKSGKILCVQPSAAAGTITAGPQGNQGYIWWNINFDTGCDGWSVQSYLTASLAETSLTQLAAAATTTDISALQSLIAQLQAILLQLQGR